MQPEERIREHHSRRRRRLLIPRSRVRAPHGPSGGSPCIGVTSPDSRTDGGIGRTPSTGCIFFPTRPASLSDDFGFSRDVAEIGHFGTGDLELRIHDDADLERAKPLIEQSYDGA